MGTVISVEGLHKTYRDTVAVDHVSFDVGPGEIFGLLGPNGAGKTTTVECLQGLRHPDGGAVSVLGLDPRTDVAALRRRIGSQLQESALPDRIKVWEALELFTTVAPGAAHWPTLMEQWGLTAKRNATFASLSGGQQQRLFVALALVNQPELVFLDEMTTGLDPAARRTAWKLIEDIRNGGSTIVLVTHFMDEAEALCDRLAVIDRGRVVDAGAPQELIARHAPDVRVRFSTDVDDLGWLERVDGAARVERRGASVEVDGRGPLLARVAAGLVERGIVPEDLRVERSSLEDVFLRLTGGER
jgi:ABC-2 type transport system ATP-binding protein